jgi:putative hydrolase of HD superfamily
MNFERWDRQLKFIMEIDKLKNIFQKTPLICTNRLQNYAEHSWHVTLMTIIFLEYATCKQSIDLFKVVKMLLVHDLIMIHTNDAEKTQRKFEEANYLFAILPEDQHLEMFRLWKEFEDQKTLEAKYAIVIDRMQHLLLTYFAQGSARVNNEINLKQELKRNEILQEIAPALWDYAKEISKVTEPINV